MTTDFRELCRICAVPLGDAHRRGCVMRTKERWSLVDDHIRWWPIVEIGDCCTALDRASDKLEGAMLDVRRATDASGLKIMLVDPMNLHAVKEKFVSLSRLMIDVIDERAALIDMHLQSRDTDPKGRVALANHVKLLAALLEAYWEYELVNNGQHQTA